MILKKLVIKSSMVVSSTCLATNNRLLLVQKHLPFSRLKFKVINSEYCVTFNVDSKTSKLTTVCIKKCRLVFV